MSDDIQKFVTERNAALAALDMDYARSHNPHGFSDGVLLMGMHKARYECIGLAPELRHASAVWLGERGYKRLTGMPLLPAGELPT